MEKTSMSVSVRSVRYILSNYAVFLDIAGNVNLRKVSLPKPVIHLCFHPACSWLHWLYGT